MLKKSWQRKGNIEEGMKPENKSMKNPMKKNVRNGDDRGFDAERPGQKKKDKADDLRTLTYAEASQF